MRTTLFLNTQAMVSLRLDWRDPLSPPRLSIIAIKAISACKRVAPLPVAARLNNRVGGSTSIVAVGIERRLPVWCNWYHADGDGIKIN